MDEAKAAEVLRLRREPAIVMGAPALFARRELPRTTMPLGRAVKRVALCHIGKGTGARAGVYFSRGVLDADECRELWSLLGAKLTDGIEHVL